MGIIVVAMDQSPRRPLSYFLSCTAAAAFGLVLIGLVLLVGFGLGFGFGLSVLGLLWIVAIGILVFCPRGIFDMEGDCMPRFNILVFLVLPAPQALFSCTVAPGYRPPRFTLAA